MLAVQSTLDAPGLSYAEVEDGATALSNSFDHFGALQQTDVVPSLKHLAE